MSKKPRVQKATTEAAAGRGSDQFVVRFPAGMRDRVAAMAANNGRSMNAEIIAAVERHLKGPDRLDALEKSLAYLQRHVNWITHRTSRDLHMLADGCDTVQAAVQELERATYGEERLHEPFKDIISHFSPPPAPKMDE
ncbi:MAG: Arc family DNA-binding protein [Variibacter sp.]